MRCDGKIAISTLISLYSLHFRLCLHFGKRARENWTPRIQPFPTNHDRLFSFRCGTINDRFNYYIYMASLLRRNKQKTHTHSKKIEYNVLKKLQFQRKSFASFFAKFLWQQASKGFLELLAHHRQHSLSILWNAQNFQDFKKRILKRRTPRFAQKCCIICNQ